jgi:hypothetical protein
MRMINMEYDLEGITEFLATLEAKTPGKPNDFIDESVLEEVLRAR